MKKLENYKVIFHLNEEEKASTVFSNINNLLADLGEDNVDIELLMNGDGVKAILKSGKYGSRVYDLSDRGVTFKICSHSLKDRDIVKNDIFEVAEIVPSGVGELVKKQSDGWVYIRP